MDKWIIRTEGISRFQFCSEFSQHTHSYYLLSLLPLLTLSGTKVEELQLGEIEKPLPSSSLHALAAERREETKHLDLPHTTQLLRSPSVHLCALGHWLGPG